MKTAARQKAGGFNEARDWTQEELSVRLGPTKLNVAPPAKSTGPISPETVDKIVQITNAGLPEK